MAMNEGFNLVSRAVAASSTPRVKARSNWAKVETIDPLTIILDEDASETPREVSENAVGLLEVNQRVRFAHEDKRLVITEAPDKVDRRFSSRIPAGADLNNYIIPGNYYNPENVEVAGFSNAPSGTAGALVVLETSTSPGSGVGVVQYWHGYSDTTPNSYIWRRRLYNGSWSAWAKINDGAEWPKPRRMGLTNTISVPTATDYRTWNWAGMANDPGNVAGGITYSEGGFTVPQAGVYTVSTVIRWLDGAFTQNAELKLFTGPSLNNTTQDECMLFHSHQYMHCAWTVYLEEGYRAEVWLRQISGVSRTIGGNPAYNWYQIARVG